MEITLKKAVQKECAELDDLQARAFEEPKKLLGLINDSFSDADIAFSNVDNKERVEVSNDMIKKINSSSALEYKEVKLIYVAMSIPNFSRNICPLINPSLRLQSHRVLLFPCWYQSSNLFRKLKKSDRGMKNNYEIVKGTLQNRRRTFVLAHYGAVRRLFGT